MQSMHEPVRMMHRKPPLTRVLGLHTENSDDDMDEGRTHKGQSMYE